jgi:two-component system, chemotaxis family, sensor kinase CheA
MSAGEDEEILQDFLVEAGEIIELLSEQLVDLEQRPDDRDLLNAIFRGFHTVKGGAGFLQLSALVECCHITENLFDVLRNGKRSVTPALMDVVLQALDAVNEMFKQVKAHENLTPAPPALIARLGQLLQGDSEAVVSASAPAKRKQKITKPKTTKPKVANSDPITDGAVPEAAIQFATATSSNDEINDDEFEALLDQLHGKGRSPGESETTASTTLSVSVVPPAASGNDDIIHDDEFEALLDQLHGKGQGPTAIATNTPTHNNETNAQSTNSVAASFVPPIKSTETPIKSTPIKNTTAHKVLENKAGDDSDQQKNGASAENTVRVDTQRLDDIMNMVGELVLVRNRLVRLGGKSHDAALAKAVGNLDVVTADLQTAVMKTRMQPIKKVFGRFPRVVRDLARSLKKEVLLELQGEDTDLDKNLVEALADPLVHLVRNAVDHGIESPEQREQAGKPRAGRIVLAAEQEGDHILLSITDDGAGMDVEVLRQKVVEKGLLDADAAARLSDTECYNLIFLPGLSTKAEISDVSGRGVGMDVVKTKISQLNGSIQIVSKIGEGTQLFIKVPLTLAIMPTLMVMLGQQTFALPLASVNEIFLMDLRRINVIDGREVITVREKAIPLFFLKSWLVKNSYGEPRPAEAHVVIVSVGIQRVGFVVDQLIGQEEVVIKPLGKMLQGTPGMAGATITGDGRIALILDVPSMLKRYAR